MSRLPREEVHLPNLHLPPPSVERIVEKAVKPSLASRVGIQLFVMTLYHAMIGNIGLAWIPFVLAAVLGLIGWKVMPPKDAKEKAEIQQKRIRDVAGNLPINLPEEKPAIKPPIIPTPAKIVTNQIGGKIDNAKGEVIDAIKKKAEDRVAAEREQLIVEARSLGVPFQPDWPTDKLRAEVLHVKEENERKELTAEATKLGYGVSPSWDLPTLRKQVKLARDHAAADVDYQLKYQQWLEEDEKYQEQMRKGPNARCPNCRHAMRFPKSRKGTQFVCPSCSGIFFVTMAWTRWTPPAPPKPPLPPKMSSGFLGNFFK